MPKDATTDSLPEGWQRCRLPAFVGLEMGQSPPSRTYNDQGDGLPFFQGKAEFGDLYPSIEKYCSEPKKIAQSGATLLSIRAPVGPTNLAPRRCCIGRGLAALHPEGGIDPKFVLYLFRAIEPELSSAGTGSTFKAITKSFLQTLQVDLPPLPEQDRIVAKLEELLSELDKGVESLQTARAQLEAYRQALLKYAFEGKLTAHWRREHPDQLDPKQALQRVAEARQASYRRRLEAWEGAVQEWQKSGKPGRKPRKPPAPSSLPPLTDRELDELPDIPAGWAYARFGAFIGDIQAGKSFKCDERVPSEDEVGVAKVSAVSWGEYDETESKTCLDPERISPDLFIHPGDFLFSRANTIELVGACVIVRDTTKDVMLSDKTLRLVLHTGRDEFFLHYLRSHAGRREIMKRSTGNQQSMRNIGQERIRSIIVPVCSAAEAFRIEEMLSQKMTLVRAVEATIDNELLRSRALRQSLLRRAFAGDLVRHNPDDEPASALLARIARDRDGSSSTKKERKAS